MPKKKKHKRKKKERLTPKDVIELILECVVTAVTVYQALKP